MTNGRSHTPWITYTLIALSLLVFVGWQNLGANEQLAQALAVVPQEILTGQDAATHQLTGLQPTPIPVYFTLLTTLALHTSIVHLLGNLLYLWLFGTPVELVLGHGRFLALYLLAGVLASLVYVTAVTAFNLNRYAPIIGASGAVSALLAAYLLLWRLGKLPNLPTSTKLLASVGLAVWLLWHLLGFFPTGSMAAHLGGFAAGFLLTWPLAGVSKR